MSQRFLPTILLLMSGLALGCSSDEIDDVQSLQAALEGANATRFASSLQAMGQGHLLAKAMA